MTFHALNYRPSFPPGYRPGVGIIGCGGIVKLAHLPAYTAYGVDVVGVYDPAPEATRGIREQFPIVGRVFQSVDELLAQPEIEIVDIATHPAQRLELMRLALAAGKHVLSQKPFTLDIGAARELVEEAERRGLRLAVNQNGRWAPAWRIATLLVEQGAVGEVCAVTHLYEHGFPWTLGSWPDELEHFVIYDFSAHWIDITRCWLDGKEVSAVRALEYRNPGQPAASNAPWGAWVLVDYSDGSSAMIRGVGSETQRPGDPFWIHGTHGTIRGSVRKGTDFVELERTDRFRASRSKASGFQTASPGHSRSSAVQSPRTVSPFTRPGTTCCHYRFRSRRAARPSSTARRSLSARSGAADGQPDRCERG